MKTYSYAVSSAILFMAFLFTACIKKDESPKLISKVDTLTVNHSMKGWELYSWPHGSSWKFAFFIGTNRLKSLAEVTDQPGNALLIRVTGVDSVKRVLNRFPHGESLTIIGQGWLQNAWGAQTYGTLQLPSQSVIDDLKAYGAQKGLSISATN